MTNEEALLEAVEGCPNATAGEIAHHLGMDRSNVRRDLKKLWRDGKVIGWDDGGKFRFSLPGDAAQVSTLANVAKPTVSVIDVDDFKEIPTPHSDSRALVVHHGASHPADNRMPTTLRRAQSGARCGSLATPQFQAALNSLCVADPYGDESLFALAEAVNANAAAVRAAEIRAAKRQEEQRRADELAAQKAKEAGKQREWDDAIRSALRWGTSQEEEKPEYATRHDDEAVHFPTWAERKEAERAEAEVEAAEKAKKDEASRKRFKQLFTGAKKPPPPPPCSSLAWQWSLAIAALGVFVIGVVMTPLRQV